MYPKVKADIDRGHHGAGVRRVRMLLSAAGQKLSSAAVLGQISVNLAQTHKTSTAVLTVTDPDLLNDGSSAVARTPSYC